MTKIQRNLISRTLVIGIALTLLVISLDASGKLTSLDRWFYDRRARHFQHFAPPPTTQLVHVDIDDPALDDIGRWPWSRDKMAHVLDEIRRAGAKAVALDIIYSEPEAPVITTQPNGGYDVENHDSDLANAIRQSGNVVLPFGNIYDKVAPLSATGEKAKQRLLVDLEISYPQINAILGNALSTYEFQRALHEAMRSRIEKELAIQVLSSEELAVRLLPRQTRGEAVSPQSKATYLQEYQQALSEKSVRRFSVTRPASLEGVLMASHQQVTIGPLADAAARIGSADDITASDGVVRAVPLWDEYDGRLYPQLALALACQYLNADLSNAHITQNTVSISRSDGPDIVIPVHTETTEQVGAASLFMSLPWFGTSDWKTAFDPAHIAETQHVPIIRVYDAYRTSQSIHHNNLAAEDALTLFYSSVDPAGDNKKLDAFQGQTHDLDDAHVFDAPISAALKDYKPEYDDARKAKEGDQGISVDIVQSYELLGDVQQHNPALGLQLEDLRGALQKAFGGKAVLIGFTSSQTDVRTTPLYPAVPGVIAHGVIFNAIVTGRFWRVLPWWMTVVATIMIGLASTYAVALLSPKRAFVAVLVLLVFYGILNCVVLFDWGGQILGMAGPVVAGAGVWAALTLYRFVAVTAERAHIESRFRTYVDPTLVDYVMEHPEKAELKGEELELTVVFTDLQGFTAIADKLGAQSVDLLKEYMELMVPHVHAHGGYLNKFLGDGLMFFYGAPRANLEHAKSAVRTILDMQKALVPFNTRLKERGLPAIGMRAGISTGLMIVGDAGPAKRSDYTVLGDLVNLGARLESANKATGSKVLATGRTVELIGEGFLVRPIGKLQVMGKSEGVMTYEPLARMEEATEGQKRLAVLTGGMVEAFVRADFEGCILASKAMEEEVGEGKLLRVYRELSESHLRIVPAGFDGRIVLQEK